MEEDDILETYQEFEDYFKSYLGFNPYGQFEKKFQKYFTKEKKIEEGKTLANKIKAFKNSIKFIQKVILENLEITEDKLTEVIDQLLIIDRKKYNPLSLSNDILRKDLDQIVSFSQADLIRALIAVECLENFLHDSIKDQPFLQAMIFHKLVYSKKPLNEVERTALMFFWKIVQPEIESNIQKNYLKHYYSFLSTLVLPPDKIDIAFRIHIRSFNNYHQHLIQGDKNLPFYLDMLIDENLQEYRSKSITRDFIYFLFDVNELFNKTKIPFNVNHFKTMYHTEIEKDSLYVPNYVNNISLVDNYWNKIPEIGGGFSYNGHWEHFGVSYYLIIFQVESEAVKLQDIIKNLPFSARSCSFLSGTQKEIYFLYFYYLKSQQQKLEDLFNSLFNQGLIKFFLINELNSINIFCSDLYADVTDQTRITYNSRFDVKNNAELYHPDLFDMFLFEELRLPITGFALRTNEDMALKIQDRIRNTSMDLLVELGNIDSHSKELQEENPNPDLYFPFRILSNKANKVTYLDLMNLYIKKLGVIATNYMITRLVTIIQFFLDLKEQGVILSEIIDMINQDRISQVHGPMLKIFIELKKNILELNKFFKVVAPNLKIHNLIQLWSEYLNELVNSIESNGSISNITKLRSIEFLTNYSDYKERRIKLIPLIKKIQEEYLSLDINAITVKALSRLGYFKNKEIISPNFLFQMGGANPYCQKIIFINTIIDENLKKRIQILGKITPFGFFNEILYNNNLNPVNLVYIHLYFKNGMQYLLDNLIEELFPNQVYFMTTIFEKDTFLFHYYTLFNVKTNGFDIFNDSIKDLEKLGDLIKEVQSLPLDNKNPVLYFNLKPIPLENMSESTQKYIIKIISEYCNQIKVYENQKDLSSQLNKISEIYNILLKSDILDEILNNNKRFYMDIIEKISYKINWQYFCMDTYIFHFSFSKEKDNIENRKLLLLPGIIKIEKSIDTGYFQNLIFHYILPNNQVPAKLINYLYSHNIISRFRLMRIKKIIVSYNPKFTFGENDWKSSYRSFDILADNLIHDSKYFKNFTPTFLEYNFDYQKDRTFEKESPETLFIKDFLDLDLRKLISLKHLVGTVNNLISQDIIKPYLEINTNKIRLYLNAVWFISPIKPQTYQSVLNALSLLPYCQIYEVESIENCLLKENLNPDLSFFVFLSLPNSRINELYLKMSEIFARFEIEKFEWISDVKEETIKQFMSDKDMKVVHPFQSHISIGNKWQLVDLFDNKGVPLSYSSRLKQIQ